ncbi:hypothetical protein [Deinococcus planocerae]|uniref:hypothetical protein n=1 Tax=Deinococcus planocerae TaxID=1737569 RepID=UPI000C7ECB3F|nr:hypothetical protein [Deinococcus planocerae]
MRRALFLACLTLGPAVAAAPGRTGVPSGSSFSTVAVMEQARPTLDLLVTVRLLDALVERGTLVPGTEARAELREALGELPTRPTLGPLSADRTLARVRGALTGTQRGTLDAARADLERRANLNLSRARFAAADGPANVALLRYGFMLPGGFALARQVAANPELNPYARPGTSAATLERLLALLES